MLTNGLAQKSTHGSQQMVREKERESLTRLVHPSYAHAKAPQMRSDVPIKARFEEQWILRSRHCAHQHVETLLKRSENVRLQNCMFGPGHRPFY